jgi:steroid Delta-isomerase
LIDERKRKSLILEHSRRMNAGDIEALLDLYADEPEFEDPVGAGRHAGRDALRAHFAQRIAAGIQETPGDPVAGQDGRHALVPITAVMDHLPKGPVFAVNGWPATTGEPEGKHLRWEYVLMIRTGADGRIEEFKAFWGRSDLEFTS